MSTGEAAARLGVKPDTVLKWIRRGRLPARKTPGGHHRIDAALVERLAASPPDAVPAPGGALAETCWEFFGRHGRLREECTRCVVYRIRASYCFEVLRLGDEMGHQRLFCSRTCEACPYYRRVHGQPLTLLVVTPDPALPGRLASADHEGLRLEFASGAYDASARIAESPPVAVMLDAAFPRAARDALRQALQTDPRIPWVEVVLAGLGGHSLEQEIRAAAARILSPAAVR